MLHSTSRRYAFTSQTLTELTSLLERSTHLSHYCLPFFRYAHCTLVFIIVHQYYFSPTSLNIIFYPMAMINQLNRASGQPTPYFFRGPIGVNPAGVNPHVSEDLTLDYRYLCSPLCRGLPTAPWFRPAAAVAPMIELDLAWQLAQDVSILPVTASQS